MSRNHVCVEGELSNALFRARLMQTASEARIEYITHCSDRVRSSCLRGHLDKYLCGQHAKIYNDENASVQHLVNND